MRNKRGNLFFQEFSYIWNEPIFLDSILKYFFYFFQFFFTLWFFFLTYFENEIFHKIPTAAAAVKNFSRSSGYVSDTLKIAFLKWRDLKKNFSVFKTSKCFFYVICIAYNFFWGWVKGLFNFQNKNSESKMLNSAWNHHFGSTRSIRPNLSSKNDNKNAPNQQKLKFMPQ